MEYASKNEMSYELISRLSFKTKDRVTPASKRTQLYCPFHDEKNPSMFIDMQKGIYHCFSCRRSGTINNLCKELTGKTIYKFLNLKYDEFQEFSKVTLGNSLDLDKVPSVVIKESDNGLCRGSGLDNIKEVNSFLRRRGLNRDIARDFKMFFTDGKMIRYNGTLFADRVCIPIYEGGKLVSIEGRALTPNITPKVLYPKGSSVSTLFEYDKLNKDERLYIVEGLMDLALLRQDSFFNNSTCIFGASISERQKHLLKKFREVIYIKENDAAGEGCVKDLLKIPGIEKGFLKIPKTIKGVEIKDVGDFVRAGYTVEKYRTEKNWIQIGLIKLH